jgi:hypothetical protein
MRQPGDLRVTEERGIYAPSGVDFNILWPSVSTICHSISLADCILSDWGDCRFAVAAPRPPLLRCDMKYFTNLWHDHVAQ